MKLRTRLFLGFFLFSFLPVAIISYISLELALIGFGRITAPGLQRALNGAQQLAQISLTSDTHRAWRVLRALPAGAPATDIVPFGFDYVQITTPTDTTEAWSDAFAEIRGAAQQPTNLIFADRSDPLGLARYAGHLLGYATEPGPERTIRGAFLLGADHTALFQDLEEDLYRFNQLSLLQETNVRVIRLIWIATVLAYLLLIVWVTRQTARRFTRPLLELGEMVERVGPGAWDVQLDYRGDDEIGTLVAGFNRMSVRLAETTARLVETEKAAAWQQTARIIAHGIKNILAPIKLAMARLGRSVDPADSDLASPLATIQSELALLERTARDFSTYGRPLQAHPVSFDLNLVVRQATRLCHPAGEIELDLASALPSMTGDREMIREALTNIVKNGCEAAAGRGAVIVTTRAVSDGIEVTIADPGPGIPPEIASRMFEPYQTTKAQGTGLGLAIARKIIVSSGGSVRVATGETGTAVHIRFGAGEA